MNTNNCYYMPIDHLSTSTSTASSELWNILPIRIIITTFKLSLPCGLFPALACSDCTSRSSSMNFTTFCFFQDINRPYGYSISIHHSSFLICVLFLYILCCKPYIHVIIIITFTILACVGVKMWLISCIVS